MEKKKTRAYNLDPLTISLCHDITVPWYMIQYNNHVFYEDYMYQMNAQIQVTLLKALPPLEHRTLHRKATILEGAWKAKIDSTSRMCCLDRAFHKRGPHEEKP
jgi:hypothetical protein